LCPPTTCRRQGNNLAKGGDNVPDGDRGHWPRCAGVGGYRRGFIPAGSPMCFSLASCVGGLALTPFRRGSTGREEAGILLPALGGMRKKTLFAPPAEKF